MCTAAYSTAQTDAAISAVEHWMALDVGITPRWQEQGTSMQHTHEIPPLNTFGYVSLAELKFRGFTW